MSGDDVALEHKQQYCDVQLNCSDGKYMRTHRVMLAAASPVFHQMFTNGMQESVLPCTVDIVDCTVSQVYAFVLTLYVPQHFCHVSTFEEFIERVNGAITIAQKYICFDGYFVLMWRVLLGAILTDHRESLIASPIHLDKFIQSADKLNNACVELNLKVAAWLPYREQLTRELSTLCKFTLPSGRVGYAMLVAMAKTNVEIREEATCAVSDSDECSE